jgi:hypothetical protein
MITLVKFITNKLEDAPPNNKVITKTLGKTGVLSWEHIENPHQVPKAEEFWYVEIVKEKGAGTPRGVFLLKPIQQIHSTKDDGSPDIVHMIPGTYTSKLEGNTILLHPKILHYPDQLGPNWICSLTMKRRLMSKYRRGDDYQVNSIIVVFDHTTTWPKEALASKKSLPVPEERRDDSMSPT